MDTRRHEIDTLHVKILLKRLQIYQLECELVRLESDGVLIEEQVVENYRLTLDE